MAKGKYPTAPRQTGKWTVTINAQKRVGADKVDRLKSVAPKPSRKK